MPNPENAGTTIHQNVQNYSPNKTVSHSRGPESSSINTECVNIFMVCVNTELYI